MWPAGSRPPLTERSLLKVSHNCGRAASGCEMLRQISDRRSSQSVPYLPKYTVLLTSLIYLYILPGKRENVHKYKDTI